MVSLVVLITASLSLYRPGLPALVLSRSHTIHTLTTSVCLCVGLLPTTPLEVLHDAVVMLSHLPAVRVPSAVRDAGWDAWSAVGLEPTFTVNRRYSIRCPGSIVIVVPFELRQPSTPPNATTALGRLTLSTRKLTFAAYRLGFGAGCPSRNAQPFSKASWNPSAIQFAMSTETYIRC